MSAAFLALGFLVGNLTGLSASPIASVLIPAVFALLGGSVLGFLSKLSERDRPIASNAILCFSFSCLVGTYLGILVNTRQLLGPWPLPNPASASGAEATGQKSYLYLRGSEMSQIDAVDQRVRSGSLTASDGYTEILKILRGIR